ncbi:hypothetical protein FHS77_001705 [Paenochrobactrum gallinarii]|uniref:Uncharacterized protein n=1 Tax=Paenochrobactrum gallinarii TaxID=643673 RepID=A0A841LSH7_9HYPH|nr:hypothetical protein [Paenochrobactrum gallinarii]
MLCSRTPVVGLMAMGKTTSGFNSREWRYIFKPRALFIVYKFSKTVPAFGKHIFKTTGNPAP